MYSNLKFFMLIVLMGTLVTEAVYADKSVNSAASESSQRSRYFKYFLLLNPPLPAPLSNDESLSIPDYRDNPDYQNSLKLAVELAAIVTNVTPEKFAKKMNQVPCKMNVACNDPSVKYIIVLGSLISGRPISAITKDYMGGSQFDSSYDNRLRTNAFFAAVAAILGKNSKDIFEELKNDSEAIGWKPNETDAAVIATRLLMKLSKDQYYSVFELTGERPSGIKKWLTNISILSGTPVQQLMPKYESRYVPREANLTQLMPVIAEAFGFTKLTEKYANALAAVEAGKEIDHRYSDPDEDNRDNETSGHSCVYADGKIYYDEDGTIYCGEVFFDSYGLAYKVPPGRLSGFINHIRGMANRLFGR